MQRNHTVQTASAQNSQTGGEDTTTVKARLQADASDGNHATTTTTTIVENPAADTRATGAAGDAGQLPDSGATGEHAQPAGMNETADRPAHNAQAKPTDDERDDENEEATQSEDEDIEAETADFNDEAIAHALQATQTILTPANYENDDEFAGVYRFLTCGQLTGDDKADRAIVMTSELYVLKHGLLYKLQLPRGKHEYRIALERLCIPKMYRAEILHRFHDLLVHHGIQKTYLSISSRFFWKSLFKDITDFVKSCHTCQISKRNYTHRAVPLHPLHVPTRPFTQWHVDFKVLTRKTRQGNTAVLCCIDAFSNWPILIPCKDQTAYTTAKAIVQHVVCSWGVPEIIFSDRGINFTADLFKYMARMLHMTQRISASKNPRSNGLAESLVQRLSQMLKRFEMDDLDIELCIPLVELSLRASSLTRLPYSPFEIINGRAMNIGEVPSDNSAIPFQGDIGNYVAMLRRELNRVHDDVRQRKIENKRLDSEAYDRLHKVAAPTWVVGQQVLLESRVIKKDSNTVLTKRPWVGPYLISEIVEGHGCGKSYRLIHIKSGKTYKFLITSDRMKPYCNSRIDLEERLPGVNKPPMAEPASEENQIQADTAPAGDDRAEQSPALVDGFEPALKIVQQRTRNKQLEYLVLFSDGSVWWCQDDGVSPQLLRIWRLKQAANRSKRNKRRLKSKTKQQNRTPHLIGPKTK